MAKFKETNNIKCFSIVTHPDDFDHEINTFLVEHNAHIIDIQTHITHDKKLGAIIFYTDNQPYAITVLKNSLYYLRAKYEVDNEVMEPDDKTKLEQTIVDLEKIINSMK